MSHTHGDLFKAIGEIVVAAHGGSTIDLTEKANELASRYETLGVSAEIIARATARALGAVSVSMAMLHGGQESSDRSADSAEVAGPGQASAEELNAALDEARAASALFPSGVSVAVLS